MKNKKSYLMWLVACVCIALSACESSTFSDAEEEITKQEKIEQVKQVYQARGWSIRTDVTQEEFEAYCDTVNLEQLDYYLVTLEDAIRGDYKVPSDFSIPEQTGMSRAIRTVTLVGQQYTNIGDFGAVIIIQTSNSENNTVRFKLLNAYVVPNHVPNGWEDGDCHYYQNSFEIRLHDSEDELAPTTCFVQVYILYAAYMGTKAFQLRGKFTLGATYGEIFSVY